MAAFDTTRPTYASRDKSLNAFFFKLAASVAAWNDSRRTRKALERLSDYELNDIGLTRADINSF
ncbi:DUF1127 domain-containing protein [Marivita sp. S2033]|uniref:DUF1127 domain-containing protein n=1 Tax=Marivita sp. S2033 TaxID=3373187 RepID=UPI003982C606